LLGILLGFTVVLCGAESYRRRVPLLALIAVFKSMGLGMLIEIGCIIAAQDVFGVGVLIHL